MQMNIKKTLFLVLLSLSLLSPVIQARSVIKKDETVIFFPTNALLDSKSNRWIIPIHGWIYEKEERSLFRKMGRNSLSSLLGVEPDESSRLLFKDRTQMFLVDNERGKKIEIEFSEKSFAMGQSKENGHFFGVIQKDDKGIDKSKGRHWINFRAITSKGDPRLFQGKAQLISPLGISVISDIDDTIKISNVKDKEALLKNTFLKPFRPVSGMAHVFQNWEQQGAAFHYLSASPWHLYPALSEFISNSGFPEGSYNLKNFRIKDQSFFNLFSSQQQYKKPIVEKLLKKYPGRRFILVGDAGEEDPEIFADIARSYPQQVVHIFIRDLNSDKAQNIRYQKTFAGISKTRWSLFREGSDIVDFKISN